MFIALLLLALDTSSPLIGVCLLENGSVKAELAARSPTQQGTDHIALIDSLFQITGTHLAAVEAFAITIGPGSFTGLRVGLSLLKGFTADGKRPLYDVSTLNALAASLATPLPVAVCLDARRSEVYGAVYKDAKVLVPEGAYVPLEFARLARESVPGGLLWAGAGSRLYAGALLKPNDRLAPALFDFPRPAAVAELAWRRWQAGERPQSDRLVPNYLRASEAERNAGSRKRV